MKVFKGDEQGDEGKGVVGFGTTRGKGSSGLGR